MQITARHTDLPEGAPICAEGGALMVTPVLETVQHTGWVFCSTHQSDVGSGNVASLTFTVAGTATPGHVHFGYEVISEGECEVAFYEGTVRTANTGNATTPICMNRANARVSAWGSSSIYKDATLNQSAATLLDVEVIGNAKQVGGRAVPPMHWIVCRGKTYSVVVTNQSGAANEITIRILWGRHVEVD